MEEGHFIWEHFKFNAEQRLKGFNFFIVLSIFADGGVFTAIEKGLNPILLCILGVFIIILSVVFLIMDTRSQNLLRLTIPALKKIESDFSDESRLFAIDAREQGSIVRYTTAIRILLTVQSLFGIGVFLYGFRAINC